MSVSRVIEVSFGGGSIAYAKVDTAYFYNNGIIFKPTDIDLPASYQVHWADSPQASSTLETIGTAEGAPIPDDLWGRSRVIYGWIYLHPTNDSSITAYEVRIYKNVRAGLPDGTEPTPAEQSTIDQLISALNGAVEQTGEDAESAEQAKDDAESARDNAQTYANNAQSSAQASASSAESASQSASQASTSATASAESAEQAAQIKMDVEALADDAQGYAESASQSASASAQSASASANSASDAQGYANSASASAQSASGYASSAQTSAQTASAKASEASTSASTASQKATEAAQSATNASQSAQTAEQAKTASQTAQGLAESARDSAVSAKTDAESAKADAESARDEAQQAVASISGALAEKAPVITDTASGAIASFTDGADDLPLKSLVVDINPVQDLHGQDAPYPAGGGKNLLPYAIIESPLTKNGITFVRNQDGSIAVNGTSTASFAQTFVEFSLQPGSYYFNCGNSFSMQSNTYVYIRDIDNGITLVNITIGNIGIDKPFSIDVQTNVRFYMVFSQTDLVISGTIYPMIRLASVTDATYAPYENICPISGWTEVDVEQRGVNVWDEEWEAGNINPNTGINQANPNTIRSKNYIPCKGNAQYNMFLPWAHVFYYDSNKQFITYKGNGVTEDGNIHAKEMTTPSNAAFMRFRCTSVYGTTYNHDISINYPSTDHDYHPYTGRSIAIPLGQTVYGGKLDVLTGILTVYPYYDSYNGETLTGEWISDRDKYVAGTAPTIGAQVVNIGAQGVTVQLEPHEVASLYGVNNIWADSGDCTAEYRADTKLFIERLTAPDSADMIADSNITSGQYFMVGNSLYKATASIANGAQIIVGTNCIRKSLSEALNEINA